MELQFETVAMCHPSDIWAVIQPIDQWSRHTAAFGQAGWVHGEPWKPGSRFFLELNLTLHMDLEVVVLKCREPHEIVLLSHGGGIACEQWLQLTAQGPGSTFIRTQTVLVGATTFSEAEVRTSLETLYAGWFHGLKAAAETYCSVTAR